MSTPLTIPEWVGSTLTHGAFLLYADKVLAAYVGVGLDQINLTAIGMQLTEAIDVMRLAVNRQRSFDETSTVAESDNDRDALAFVLWHAWNHLQRLSSSNPLTPHVKTLHSEMTAYKGVWNHELGKETTEIKGWRGDLSTDANRAALAALGLDKIADALWAANTVTDAAMAERDSERGERAAEKAAGTTPELRKAVSALLVKAAKRVNAVYDFDPDNEHAATAIQNVVGIIEHYKQIASEAKHRKGDEPEPEPEPAPEAQG